MITYGSLAVCFSSLFVFFSSLILFPLCFSFSFYIGLTASPSREGYVHGICALVLFMCSFGILRPACYDVIGLLSYY